MNSPNRFWGRMILSSILVMCVTFIISAQIEITNVIRPDVEMCNGAFAVYIEGDAGPYTIEVVGGNIDQMIEEGALVDELCSGSYKIMARDKYGCNFETEFTLEERICDLSFVITNIQHLQNCAEPGCLGNPESNNYIVCDPGSIALSVNSDESYIISAPGLTGGGSFNNNYTSSPVLTADIDGFYEITVSDYSDPDCFVTQEVVIKRCGVWINGQSQIKDDDDSEGAKSLTCTFDAEKGLAQVDVSLSDLKGTDSGECNGMINIDVIASSNAFTAYWTGPNGFESSDEDISGLCAGTYIYQVDNGCDNNEYHEWVITECSEEELNIVSVNENTLEGTSCSPDNSIDIEVSYEESNANFSLYVELRKNNSMIQSKNVSSNQFSFNNVGNGIYEILIFDYCNPVLSVDIDLSSSCPDFSGPNNFPGFEFHLDCSGFGGIFNDGFNWELKVTNDSELIDFGCDWFITWPLDNGLTNDNEQKTAEIIVTGQGYEIIGHDKWQMSNGFSEDEIRTVQIVSGDGCEYSHTETMCHMNTGGDGVGTIVINNIEIPSIVLPELTCSIIPTNITSNSGFIFNQPSPNPMAVDGCTDLTFFIPESGDVRLLITPIGINDWVFERNLTNLSAGFHSMNVCGNEVPGAGQLAVFLELNGLTICDIGVKNWLLIDPFKDKTEISEKSFRQDKLEIKCSPNPFKSTFNITGSFTKKWQIFISNPSGEIVQKVRSNQIQERMTIDLSTQPNGMYFINFIDEQGEREVKRIVKMD